MTIRRRLALSFFVILLLFAVNLVIYFRGNQRRETTVEVLRRAVSRQALISGFNQNLNDIQKQLTLLNQVTGDNAGGASARAAIPAEIAQFNSQLEKVEEQITALHGLADPEIASNIDSFAAAYKNLENSWRTVYGNFGINQTKAITELAVTAEPLAQEILQKRLPELQAAENRRVDAATANFYEVARLTDRTAILIFVVSAVVAVGVALLVSGQLTRGLLRLKAGTASIGSGNLEHQIELKGNDEFADLARAFNDMAARLLQARVQLTLAHEKERNKSEELAKALDQLRKTQDQLVVQQKLASLGSLTAGIAHEIKNPLNFVTNFAEVCVSLAGELRESIEQHTEKLPPREWEYLQDILQDLQTNVSKIQEHGKRADGIVRNMLMHSRGHSGERQLTSINSLLTEYVKLAYHGMRALDPNFNISIHEDLDSSIEPIKVIAHDLSRVFLNIANNACYAAYEKKKRLGAGFSPTISTSTRNHDGYIVVCIRDNGDGMPDSIRKRIFEPFFTTKPAGSGTGLGLSMSYEIIVRGHNGQIRVDSEPGEYAEFTLVIPKDSDEP
jgi:signal transduction histidine kinase